MKDPRLCPTPPTRTLCEYIPIAKRSLDLWNHAPRGNGSTTTVAQRERQPAGRACARSGLLIA